MTNEPSSFSKYLVIFVDILGSQNRTDFQETYQINKIFHEEFEKNRINDMSHTVYFRKIYTFSDCAYIFYGFKDSDEISDDRKVADELFKVALCNCEPIFLRFVKEKILFRGGISYGDAYVDSCRSMFFGEAVNKAYKLESEIAIHPRIVIDDSIATAVLDNISSVKYKIAAKDPAYVHLLGAGLMPKIPETGDGIIEQDVDGKYIFNYLHFPENNMIKPDCYSSCENFIRELIDYCSEQIDKNSQYKIIDKYYYLLRFSQEKLDNLLFEYEL
ncbi:MAG: hypothetical protein ACYDEX_13355 [Mobilitalea sp.]